MLSVSKSTMKNMFATAVHKSMEYNMATLSLDGEIKEKVHSHSSIFGFAAYTTAKKLGLSQETAVYALGTAVIVTRLLEVTVVKPLSFPS